MKKRKPVTKDTSLQARVTKEEYNIFLQKAEEMHITVSTFVRIACFEYLKK